MIGKRMQIVENIIWSLYKEAASLNVHIPEAGNTQEAQTALRYMQIAEKDIQEVLGIEPKSLR